jgi:uncharacterized protein (TIGR00251 family)
VSGPERGFAFWIHVTPRARRDGVGGRHGDALRVAVREPPESGRANAACLEALAEAFAVSRARVELAAGARGRRKRVRVAGDPAALERRFEELAKLG